MTSDGRPPDLRKCGLWQNVTYDGAIRPGGWMNAYATGEVIGTCRACGDYLIPAGVPDPDEALPFYTARCVGCGHEAVAPGGRVLRRSGRASERHG